MAAGVLGFLSKRRESHALVEAVREVAHRRQHIATSNGIDHTTATLQGPAQDLLGLLSPREREVFRYFAEGYTTPAIADSLAISPKTVAVHHASIMAKLRLANATQLVRLAIRCLVIEP
jgi:two-component system invasion response regulator UvrY